MSKNNTKIDTKRLSDEFMKNVNLSINWSLMYPDQQEKKSSQKNTKKDWTLKELQKRNENQTNCVRCGNPLKKLILATSKTMYCTTCENELNNPN